MHSAAKASGRRGVWRPLLAVMDGYRLTWAIMKDSWREPFGKGWVWHRVWLLAQFLVGTGVAVFFAIGQGKWEFIEGLGVGGGLVVAGLVLTAISGQAIERTAGPVEDVVNLTNQR